jgi:hypothetical protein
MDPIFAERTLSPVYDLINPLSRERLRYIGDLYSGHRPRYLLKKLLGLCLRKEFADLVV